MAFGIFGRLVGKWYACVLYLSCMSTMQCRRCCSFVDSTNKYAFIDGFYNFTWCGWVVSYHTIPYHTIPYHVVHRVVQVAVLERGDGTHSHRAPKQRKNYIRQRHCGMAWCLPALWLCIVRYRIFCFFIPTAIKQTHIKYILLITLPYNTIPSIEWVVQRGHDSDCRVQHAQSDQRQRHDQGIA